MLRLMRLGLKRQALDVPEFEPPKSAHIPLTEKRSFVQQIEDRYGPAALLKIGEAIEGAPDEPMLTALSLATDTDDLIARWQRLERFVHSRHRTRVLERSEGCLVCQHYAHVGKGKPLRAEDLLIVGLLTALLDRIGIEDLRAEVQGQPGVGRIEGTWHVADLPSDASTWVFTWRVVASNAASRQGGASSSIAKDWLEAARHFLERDPGRNWSLPALANALNLSTRSLQRHLRQEGASFSSLLAETRMAAAGELLAKTQQSHAEIGYVCGFSDQAHFTRSFKRHTAMTPASYRAEFGAAP